MKISIFNIDISQKRICIIKIYYTEATIGKKNLLRIFRNDFRFFEFLLSVIFISINSPAYSPETKFAYSMELSIQTTLLVLYLIWKDDIFLSEGRVDNW